MAVLVVDEIDLQAVSRIVHVPLGMSICFRNSGSVSKMRHSLITGSLANSKALTIDSLARSQDKWKLEDLRVNHRCKRTTSR